MCKLNGQYIQSDLRGIKRDCVKIFTEPLSHAGRGFVNLNKFLQSSYNRIVYKLQISIQMNYSKSPQGLHLFILLLMLMDLQYHLQTLFNGFCTRFAYLTLYKIHSEMLLSPVSHIPLCIPSMTNVSCWEILVSKEKGKGELYKTQKGIWQLSPEQVFQF